MKDRCLLSGTQELKVAKRLGLALLLASLVTVPAEAAKMQRNVDPLIKLVTLPDGDYYAPEESLQRRISDGLSQLPGAEGDAIGCPRVVDVDQQTRLPFLWASRASNLRAWSVVAARNTAVVFTDLSTGKVSIHDPHYAPRKPDLRGVPKSREGKQQDILAPRGFRGGVEVLDLRGFANPSWNPGRFAATLLVYDWPSNTLVVELQRKGVGPAADAALSIPHAEAVALAHHQQRVAHSPYPMYKFGATPKTPPLTSPGLALLVPTEASAKKAELWVEGAARLELLPGNLVASAGSAADASPPAEGLPAAFARVTLLVLRLDAPVRPIDLQVPVIAPGALQVGQTVDLAFRVDLKSALHTELLPGEYQVYAAGGRYMAGPYPLVVKAR